MSLFFTLLSYALRIIVPVNAPLFCRGEKGREAIIFVTFYQNTLRCDAKNFKSHYPLNKALFQR